MLGHHLPASEMPFQWRFAGEPMMAQLKRYLVPLSPHQLKKNVIKFGPPLTKPSGSAHALGQHHFKQVYNVSTIRKMLTTIK